MIAANIDKLFIVGSIHEPDFNNKAIDRFIVTGESSHLQIIVVINKTDLDKDNISKTWQSLYKEIGYKVILSSVVSEEGIEKIKNETKGNKNIFWGHSGVGKSSLLNSINPELDLETADISSFIDKGTHKTVTSNMIKTSTNTYVIDTPGVREIEPYGIRKEDLSHYFTEFLPFADKCHFSTCTHFHEPDCAVIEAVRNGKITEIRYDSYLRILETIEEDIFYR